MNVSRRRYMGEKGGSIPYQRIEYLESDGTQYINTLLYGNKETAMEVDFIPISFSGQSLVAGSRVAGQNTNSLTIFTSNTSVTQRFDSRSSAITLPQDRAIVYVDKFGFKIDGITKATWSPEPTDFTTPQTIYLFGLNVTSFGRLNGRVYSFKLWQSGVLVRDFVPVRVEQVGYMYDTVSGQLFGNAGTGDFVLGPDIN